MLRTMGRWIVYPIIAVLVALVASIIAATVARPSDEVDSSFRIEIFDATYELERQPDGSLDVLVTEDLTLEFAYPGKHGIFRDIPVKYQTHRNAVTDVSVSGALRFYSSYAPDFGEQDGVPEWDTVPFDLSESDEAVRLKIGSSARTLDEGPQRYQISYRLTDVAMGTRDASAQEVYLDVSGTGWGVPIDSMFARLKVPADLADRLNGNAACYSGSEGSTNQCPVRRDGTNGFVFATRDLTPHQSMTFAVGFEPGTFERAYTPSGALSTPVLVWLSLAPGLGLFALLCVSIPPLWRRFRLHRPVVVTQYTPPEGIEPLVAADIWGRPERGVAAQMIDVVVKRQGRIVTSEEEGSQRPASEGSWLGQLLRRRKLRRSMRLELDSLPDRDMLSLLNAHGLHGLGSAGSDLDLADSRRSIVDEARVRMRTGEEGTWFFLTYVAMVITVFIATLGAVATNPDSIPWAYLSALLGVMLLVTALYRAAPAPLTDKGELAYQQLRGLENFMRLAEADRIAWLQRTETAPRVASRTDDEVLVKLYEPLLPYAMIFGLEESWGKLIGDHYARLPSADSWLPQLSGWAMSDVVRTMNFRDSGSQGGRRAFADVNEGVKERLSSAGQGIADSLAGNNDGSGGSRGGWSSGGSSRSGGSSGGGRSGGGMGGGGGGSW